MLHVQTGVGSMASEANPSAAFEKSSLFNYPPMWSTQLTLATRRRQLERWSTIVQSYCRRKRIWRLTLVDALSTELFRNARLRKSTPLQEATQIIDWMTQEDGLRRAEWVGKSGEKSSAWIYWKRPEEWAETILTWVQSHSQTVSRIALRSCF